MTKKTYTDKNGNVWEWEETPEVVKAVKTALEFAGNYQGPLYAQHPDIKKKE